MLHVIMAETEFEPWECVYLPTTPLCLSTVCYYEYYFANGKSEAQRDQPLAKVLDSVRNSIRFQGSWNPTLILPQLSPVSLLSISGKIHVYCPGKAGTFVPIISFQYSYSFGRKTVSSLLLTSLYHPIEKIFPNASSQNKWGVPSASGPHAWFGYHSAWIHETHRISRTQTRMKSK